MSKSPSVPSYVEDVASEPTRYEEEVLDRVSELNARELSRLIAELGIEDEVKEEDRGKRVKLLKATMKYFVELEMNV